MSLSLPTSDSANQPVLIAADSTERFEKLRAMVGEIQPFFLHNGVVRGVAGDASLLKSQVSGNKFAAVVACGSRFEGEMEHLIYASEREQIGPLVILSDNCETVAAARNAGALFFLSIDTVDRHSLLDALFAARSFSHTRNALKYAETEHTKARRRFDDVARHLADWLWETDADFNLTYTTSPKREMHVPAPGKPLRECFLPGERTRLTNELTQLKEVPRPFNQKEFWALDASGVRVCWALSGVPVFDDGGKLTGFRGAAWDVSVRRSSQEQLMYLANTDTLTGLLNRGRFYEEIRNRVRRLQREKTNNGLVILDLDRFKYVNDTFGHEAGDRLLVHVAQVVRSQMREGDVAARIGGDEFAVVLNETDESTMRARAHGMLQALSRSSFEFQGHMLPPSASIGLVVFPRFGEAPHQLLAHADIAMGQAKRHGKNRLHVFDKTQMNTSDTARKLNAVDLINRCLSDPARVTPHFQPIVPLSSEGGAEFFEVLARLMDENGEVVSPVKFIDTAEEFGLIGQIDRAVTAGALMAYRACRDQGRRVAFSINLSGRTFDDEEALNGIAELLKEYSPPPGTVVFEITETAALRDLSRAQRIIADLKRYGARFSLDDFGAGYCSFTYMRQLEVDFVKIDGGFIRHLHKNPEDHAVVEALQHVAGKMNIHTIAEMVEGESVVDALRHIGVDFAQGFHFSPPRPGPDVQDELLEKTRRKKGEETHADKS